MKIGKVLLGFVPRLWGNWISLIGTTLTTLSGNAILFVTIANMLSDRTNQYVDAFAYLLMPPAFALGLALIAFGAWRDSRKRRGKEGTLARAVRIAGADSRVRKKMLFVMIATTVNVTIVSLAAYQALHYMETPRFCGQLCHSVMQAEYLAYKRSAHARVACVDCHIGEGASWFVKSKLSGMRQVFATLSGDFARPIPTPIKHLRPAPQTCGKCHWPAKFHGLRFRVRHKYKDDEKNSRRTDVVRLHIGGRNERSGKFEGIHYHVAPDVRIEYEALDERRKTIGRVVVKRDGKTTTYLPVGPAKGAKVVERRTMDCVDCHNRPTHVYDPSPAYAVDQALWTHKIDGSLPFVHREAVSLLGDVTIRRTDAERVFSRKLLSFYKENYPEQAQEKRAAILGAAKYLAVIYRRNIYPELRIRWNTYPNHLGHRDTTEGCFRCHDNNHRSAEGRVIGQNCDLCHKILAHEDEDPDVPKEILRLGRM